jgi:predicted Zn finger-like uncharacterized protein
MPSTQVPCPECGTVLRLDGSLPPGKVVRCARCKATFAVPGEEPASPPPRREREEVPVARRARRRREDRDEDGEDDRPASRSRGRRGKKGGPGKGLLLGGLIAVGAVALVGGLVAVAYFAGREVDPPSGVTLKQARTGFQTQLQPHPRQVLDDPFQADGPAPVPPPRLYKLVRYPSPAGNLAAYVTPEPPDGRRRPAIVWAHGGFGGIGEDAWEEDADDTAPFRRAGFVVMWPSWRGENDNPGRFEMFYGEVDDAVAAVEYVSKLPYVDPNRVYIGGHSTGGTIALLTALSTEKVRAAFPFGGAADVENVVEDGYGYGNTPFNYRDKKECRLRSAVDYVSTLKVPTFYFEGEDDYEYCRDAARMQRLARKSGTPFHAFEVKGGDHFTIVPPLTELIAQKAAADTGATCNITITDDEVQKAFRRGGR